MVAALQMIWEFLPFLQLQTSKLVTVSAFHVRSLTLIPAREDRKHPLIVLLPFATAMDGSPAMDHQWRPQLVNQTGTKLHFG